MPKKNPLLMSSEPDEATTRETQEENVNPKENPKSKPQDEPEVRVGNRKKASELETLNRIPSNPEDYFEFVAELKERFGVAELHTKSNNREILDGDFEVIWVGAKEAPIYIGEPWLYADILRDDDDNEIARTMRIRETGFDLIKLFWSPNHNCFVMVRGDVYAKSV